MPSGGSAVGSGPVNGSDFGIGAMPRSYEARTSDTRTSWPGWPGSRHTAGWAGRPGNGASMRAVWITKAGGPEVLAVRESADPRPGAGEVRIAVRAAGLNFAEVMARQGLYPDAPKPPCVVGYEVAGVIDEVGAGVTGLEAGQRVLALVRFGGHAEAVCAPAERVLPMPDGLSFTDGAALPVNYLTAYHMLFRVANL